jgi:hypothetical protein
MIPTPISRADRSRAARRLFCRDARCVPSVARKPGCRTGVVNLFGINEAGGGERREFPRIARVSLSNARLSGVLPGGVGLGADLSVGSGEEVPTRTEVVADGAERNVRGWQATPPSDVGELEHDATTPAGYACTALTGSKRGLTAGTYSTSARNLSYQMIHIGARRQSIP